MRSLGDTMRCLLMLLAGLALCAAAPPITHVTDLPYVADGTRAHQLDLYLPSESERASLVVFVHGGAFIEGDRRQYHAVGDSLASQGLATAIVSYRLYPYADALGATRDVATAVSWLLTNAPTYHITAHNVVLTGHSAGGQIVALLATNAALLHDAGTSLARVCAAIPDAGIYDIRDISGEEDWMQRADEKIYGSTPQLRAVVSPILFVNKASPPMVVACGTLDDPDACGRAIRFADALNAAGGSAIVLREIGADHMAMLRNLIDPRDTLNQRLHAFAKTCG